MPELYRSEVERPANGSNSKKGLNNSWSTKQLCGIPSSRVPVGDPGLYKQISCLIWLYLSCFTPFSPQDTQSCEQPRVKHCTRRWHFCPWRFSAAVTVGGRRLRCDLTVSTGRLSGALRPDGAVPRSRSELSSPALGPDQLAFLGLPAPVPALPDPGPADPVWIRHHRIGHRCALHRRLVSLAQATNGCLSLFLDLIRSFFFFLSKCPIKQQMWQL